MRSRPTERPFNTPLYLLRVVQLGLRISELDDLEYGIVLDMLTEMENDNYKYKTLASQSDFNRF